MLMRRFPIDERVREIWKIYPVRIRGRSISSRHSKPTLLVQSMEGGFVTQNCPECGHRTTLSGYAFMNDIDLWVACPQCKAQMEHRVVDKNYAFACDRCDLYINLADLLPRWNEL
jgi:endogenous inhibitor of DNA gyrase (YacG/DUF329 family)